VDGDEATKGKQADEPSAADVPLQDHILAVRLGHGANCSSIGSVIDTLFASAVVTGAIFAAVCAAIATEKVTVVGGERQGEEKGEKKKDGAEKAETERKREGIDPP
jgi:hypothetical protein